MRITYDRTVDAAKIYLVEIENGAAVTQKCLPLENGEIILDFDKDGYLLGIEILGADSILKPELRIASELALLRVSGNVVKRAGVKSAEGVRALAIGLIAHLLANGLMVAGDVDDFGFHQWPGSPGDAIVRIVQSWDPAEPYPTPGSVAWLNCTPKGEALGEAALKRIEGQNYGRRFQCKPQSEACEL
jgi:uncharacterized protein YuzE